MDSLAYVHSLTICMSGFEMLILIIHWNLKVQSKGTRTSRHFGYTREISYVKSEEAYMWVPISPDRIHLLISLCIYIGKELVSHVVHGQLIASCHDKLFRKRTIVPAHTCTSTTIGIYRWILVSPCLCRRIVGAKMHTSNLYVYLITKSGHPEKFGPRT